MRKKVVAGNWKMNKTLQEAIDLTSEIVSMAKDEVSANVKVILAPPFVFLQQVAGLVKGNSNISVAAQNCHAEKSGAFTGEISVDMLKSLDVQSVIVGHSERRMYFAEDNALLAKKVNAVLEAGLSPIYCCGETIEQRQAELHFTVIKEQVSQGLFHLDSGQMQHVVIAYEPVWAIGTGLTASVEQAQEVHAFIRKLLSDKYGSEVADNISILYGGSVKPDNAMELFSAPDIDGGLVGGACLASRSFVDIARAFN